MDTVGLAERNKLSGVSTVAYFIGLVLPLTAKV